MAAAIPKAAMSADGRLTLSCGGFSSRPQTCGNLSPEKRCRLWGEGGGRQETRAPFASNQPLISSLWPLPRQQNEGARQRHSDDRNTLLKKFFMLCNFFLLICVRVCNIINVTILRGDVVRRAGGRAEVQGGQGHATGKSGSVRGKWATRLRGPRVRRSPCGPAAEASLARCTSLSQGASCPRRPQDSTLSLTPRYSPPRPAWPRA